MVICAAFGCSNRFTKKGSGISYFQFPQDRSRRAIWEHYCRRTKFNVAYHHRLCSDHFSTAMYQYNPDNLMNLGLSFTPKKTLKTDAVPDLPLLGALMTEPRETPYRGAYRKRQKSEILQEAVREYENSADYETSTEIETCPLNPPCQSVQTDLLKTRHATTQVDLKPPQRTRRLQAKPTLVSCVVQCTLLDDPKQEPDNYMKSDVESDSESDVDMTSDIESSTDNDMTTDIDNDPDYDPSDSTESLSESDEEDEGVSLKSGKSGISEKQFLVSESALYELLSICRTCGQSANPAVQYAKGTMICCTTECVMGHRHEWRSQTCHNKMPLSNLLLAGSSYFSGSSFTKVSRMLSHINLQMFSRRTYYKLQSAYLVPALHQTWKCTQRELLHQRSGRPLKLGGDGRCDSPGYSAKYGAYSIMDLETNDILDIQLVQSNEVKSSTHMELEGLQRSVRFLQQSDITIQSIVTDRHVMVKKYLKEQLPEINHFFDVWHISKGVTKKLEASAKKKGSEVIHQWIKSITNHLYWTAMTSADDGYLKLAKWKSVINHIADKHAGHSPEYPRCEHGLLEDREWIKEGSRPYKMVSAIVLSPYLLRDIPKLSSTHQTYGIEVFHSIVNHFAPKSSHFFYPSILARLYLAALHYNENSDNNQATTKDGVPKWQCYYPKFKKGKEAVVKPCKEEPSYAYVSLLLQCAIDHRMKYSSYKTALSESKATLHHCPPPLTDSYEPVDKQQLIERHRSRFNHNKPQKDG